MYEKIRELCKARKITIAELEQATGLGTRTIYRWDTNSPGIDKVSAVADYLGVTIDELTGRDVRTELFENKKLGLLLSASEDLRPEDLDFLVSMAERLRESYKDE